MKLCTPTRVLPTLASLATGAIFALGVAAAAEVRSDTPDATVEVTGERLTKVAFEELVAAFESEGWGQHRIRKDGVAVFKHRDEWKGAVLVGQHGSTRMRPPVLHDIVASDRRFDPSDLRSARCLPAHPLDVGVCKSKAAIAQGGLTQHRVCAGRSVRRSVSGKFL